MTEPSAPVPLTVRNLLIGGGYTQLIFPAALGLTLFVAVILADISNDAAVGYAVLTGVVAMVVAALFSLLAIPILGLPLAAAGAWILRGSPRIWHHLTAQFLAGAAAASVIVIFYASVENFGTYASGERMILVAVVIVTGASTALGWWLTLRRSRRVTRARPFGAIDEDWE